MKIWIARDNSGAVYLHTRKPHKNVGKWWSDDYALVFDENLPIGCNPKWEDEEPIEINVGLAGNGINIERVIKEVKDDQQMLYSKRDVIELLMRFVNN